MQPAAHAHHALGPRAVVKAPEVARAHVFISEAVVVRELLWRFRRAVLGKIRGRGTRHEPRLAELAGDEVVGTRRADADREVEALLDQVDQSVGERHIEAHFAMRGEKRSDRRRDVAHAKVHRGGEPDRAARRHGGARRFLLGLGEVGEELHRALVEGAPTLGEAHAAGRAVEEPALQMRLELGDMAGSRGRGESEPLGRLGKAAAVHDLREDLHGG